MDPSVDEIRVASRRVKADEATIARSLQAHLARGASVRPGSGAGALRLSRRADRAVRSPHGPDLDEPGLRHRSGRIGRALSRFPSSEHFCSWLTLAPGTRISGGKALKGRTAKRVNRAGQALRLAANTARHNRSFIGACHRARLRRLDKPRAIKATAHQLARLIYAMLTRGEEYIARDLAAWETERRDRTIANLQRQARRFELALVPAEAA